MKLSELYGLFVDTLNKSGFAEAESDSRLIFEYIAGIDRVKLTLEGDRELEPGVEEKLKAALDMRLTHMPVQYITGYQNFMGLEFMVSKDVLIPRMDTETLVEEVLRLGLSNVRVLDICTGSGCILLSILKYVYGSSGVGVDISDGALGVAKANSEALGIDATFIKSDMFENIPKDERFDIVVSNPPYIRSDVIGTLMSEVKDYEPLLALDGSEDGLKFYRIIADRAPEYLNIGGVLFLEIGYDQGAEVSALLYAAGFMDVEVIKDLSGLDRVVSGRIGLI
ncbi:peptide chain release factor N(5)-glutamine methyltransferase [Lacrimispora saccharolytica]|uniref:peptide chain release factor N(5)-glutamine methyltransferase n=1 Tax=Lacrimispora saccharolytica TaxID=84030 RepID=UPI00265D2F5C|nr:peptide chain release factor N(5)-glutamine methyltransferase [Lacrimispora saccharolytica]MCF2656844.1 peptide chain release factor N(5)-glutamine methyltransferase [Lacrimispora saccharolytica]